MRRKCWFGAYALRDARERAGLSRARLTPRVGVSEATGKAWRPGRGHPNSRPRCGWRRCSDRLGIDSSALKRVEAGQELPPAPRQVARVYGVTAAALAAVVRRMG